MLVNSSLCYLPTTTQVLFQLWLPMLTFLNTKIHYVQNLPKKSLSHFDYLLSEVLLNRLLYRYQSMIIMAQKIYEGDEPLT